MENNGMNFEFEPMGEQPVSEPAAQPEQPAYTQPEQPAYTPQPESRYTYQSTGQSDGGKEKKSTGKMIALIVAVALVGSIGGGLLTSAITSIRGDRQEQPPTQMEQTLPEETQPEDYELSKQELPKKLNSYDTGKSLTAAQVYELTVNSVVGIQTESTINAFGQEAVSASAGSGFILSEDGFIITNCHVVQGADKITVDLFSGESYPAQLIGGDESFDVAVLKIEAEGLPAASVGDSDELHVGEEVVAIGNPLGELTFTMTNGILSALDREINTDGNPQNMIQTDAAINSGNSGGPLFDMDGNVIGVTTAKYSGSTSSGTTIEGLGFAIPINDALKVAYDLVEHGYVKDQAYLGVTVRTLNSDTAAYYGLPIGPRVESVTSGSCAETAGIQVGDIILACDEETVGNNPELLAVLKKHKAGDTITLTVFRAGAQFEVTVTLDEKPSQEIIDQSLNEQNQQQQLPQQQLPQESQQMPQDGYTYQFPFGFDFFN